MLIENSVTRVTVRLHERCRTVTWVTEFSICTEEPLWILFFLHTLPLTVAFRLEYVLFYQFCAKITKFFDQEKFGTAPLFYADVKTFGGNWRENDVKTSKMTYYRQNRHTDVIHESSYTPHVRRHFLAPDGFTKSNSAMRPLSKNIQEIRTYHIR